VINDSNEHLAAVAAIAVEFPEMPVDIVPYHETGRYKYAGLGLACPATNGRPPGDLDYGRRERFLLPAGANFHLHVGIGFCGRNDTGRQKVVASRGIRSNL